MLKQYSYAEVTQGLQSHGYTERKVLLETALRPQHGYERGELVENPCCFHRQLLTVMVSLYRHQQSCGTTEGQN